MCRPGSRGSCGSDLRGDSSTLTSPASCARAPRGPDDDGTWISDEIHRGLRCAPRHGPRAFGRGAAAVTPLVGGLYGVHLGGAFFGESMFHHVRDASKVALVALVERLNRAGILAARHPVGDAAPHAVRCRGDSARPLSARDWRARSNGPVLFVEDEVARASLGEDRARECDRVGLTQRERRDLRVKSFAGFRDHLVGALHRAERRAEGAAGRIRERFARREHRLFSDDTGPAHFFDLSRRRS